VNKHIASIPFAFICVPRYPFTTFLRIVLASLFFWLERKKFASWRDPIAVLPRATPFLRPLGLAPTIRAGGFFKSRTMHYNGGLVTCCWSILPVIWKCPNLLSIIKGFFVAMLRIIMNKNRRVPGAVECVWSSMEALGRLVEQHITAFQYYFMSRPLIVFNLPNILDK